MGEEALKRWRLNNVLPLNAGVLIEDIWYLTL